MPPAKTAHRYNPELLRAIPADAKVVVEIGCGAGGLEEQYLRINPHCAYLGIPHIQDLDFTTLPCAPEEIDCLVYNNVLESQSDPWTVLQQQTARLRPDAVVAAALWNVQHWTVLFQLLQGHWPLQNEGILDRKHLRFFTLSSATELFQKANLNVFDVKTVNVPGKDFPQVQQLLAPVLKAINVNAEEYGARASALQYVVRGQRAPLPRPRLKIQTMMMAPLACDRLRVLEPDQFSNTIPGVHASSTIRTAQLTMPASDEQQVFVIQRANMRVPTDYGMLKEVLQRGYLIVSEMDDDPDRWPEHKANNYITFRGCHCVQTSTEPLAAFLRTLNPHVQVFANQIANLPPPRQYTEAGPVRLFFGALNREQDWAPLMPALNKVLQELKERVWVHVLHDQQFFNALATPFKTFEQFCPYERYLEVLHDCEVALLPLEPSRFNSMKSDLKYLECAAHGVAVLASPTVYEQSVQEGETGLLYRSPDEFEAKLRTLLGETKLRRRLANKAYDWVKGTRLQSRHYRRRAAWYRQMLAILPQLQADLRQRVPELFQ